MARPSGTAPSRSMSGKRDSGQRNFGKPSGGSKEEQRLACRVINWKKLQYIGFRERSREGTQPTDQPKDIEVVIYLQNHSHKFSKYTVIELNLFVDCIADISFPTIKCMGFLASPLLPRKCIYIKIWYLSTNCSRNSVCPNTLFSYCSFNVLQPSKFNYGCFQVQTFAIPHPFHFLIFLASALQCTNISCYFNSSPSYPSHALIRKHPASL